MRDLRLAVVGAGRLGGFHAQKAAAAKGVQLVAVSDPVAENRDRVARECETKAVADHRALLDSVDAVVIAAPTQLHHQLGLDFLRRGIHVLMEKPLAPTKRQCEDLVAAARESQVVLQVGHVERFNPAMRVVRPHVQDPKFIEAVRSSGFTFRSMDVGVVLDLMIHDIDLVLSMVRSPLRKVDALGFSVLGGHEDVANARLEFESGCVASLSASRVSHDATRRMSVWAAGGQADIDFGTRTARIVRPSEQIVARRFDIGAMSDEQIEHNKEHLFDEHLPREETQVDAVDALTLELEDFMGAIRGPRQPQVPGEQALEAVAVAEQILAKVAAHAWSDSERGPVGPHAIPRPNVVPAPHFKMAPSRADVPRREAG